MKYTFATAGVSSTNNTQYPIIDTFIRSLILSSITCHSDREWSARMKLGKKTYTGTDLLLTVNSILITSSRSLQWCPKIDGGQLLMPYSTFLLYFQVCIYKGERSKNASFLSIEYARI